MVASEPTDMDSEAAYYYTSHYNGRALYPIIIQRHYKCKHQISTHKLSKYTQFNINPEIYKSAKQKTSET